MKDSLVINFYGGPGAGKSTGASYVFSWLKMKGVDAEYVTEFAKELVWQERSQVFEAPENQVFIFGNQFYRMRSLLGKVSVIVTDSPLLLSVIYARSCPQLSEHYPEVVRSLNSMFRRINVLVKRVAPFEQNGRNEDEARSDFISGQVRKLLSDYGEQYYEIAGDEDGFRSFTRYLEAATRSRRDLLDAVEKLQGGRQS